MTGPTRWPQFVLLMAFLLPTHGHSESALERRVAALRAKHQQTKVTRPQPSKDARPPRRPNVPTGINAKDQQFLTQFHSLPAIEDLTPKSGGSWVPVEKLETDDWIFMAFGAAKVEGIQPGFGPMIGLYQSKGVVFSLLLDESVNRGMLFNRECCLRQVPPRAQGGLGETGRLVFRVTKETNLVTQALRAQEAREKAAASATDIPGSLCPPGRGCGWRPTSYTRVEY